MKSFIDEVITVLSLDTIAKSTLELLDKTLHPETATILLLNRLEDKYNSYQNIGLNRDITWDSKAVIPGYLKTTKEILSVATSDNSVKVPDELKEEMKKYDGMTPTALDHHAHCNDSVDHMTYQIDDTTDAQLRTFPGIYIRRRSRQSPPVIHILPE